MPKHSLPSPPLPPPKRVHTLLGETHSATPATFDALFDEIVLLIFSYLDWTDLCAVQSTNKNWSRLSLDNQLWKSLYIREYGRTRLRGARGFIGRRDGREIKPLPGRVKAEMAQVEELRDWKWMFRISSNWRTGRCSVEHFDIGCPSELFTHAAPLHDTHLLLAGNVTIVASSFPSPVIIISSPNHAPYRLSCTSSRTGTSAHITTLALDQSPPAGHHGRLICFLSTGEFALYSIDHQTPSSSRRLFIYTPTGSSPRFAPVVQAVYHHPLLVTLSQSFHLSLYRLSQSTVTHTQTLTSFTSFPPSSLVLSTPSSSTYKLILAYAVPVYPEHWTVGATELIISNMESEDMLVTNTRTTRAIDIPQGWLDEQKMRTVREQWGRKVSRVAATQTDGKWVVLAPGQELSGATAASSSSSPSRAPALRRTTASPTHPYSASPSSSAIYASSSLHSASGLQLYRLHLPASSSSSSMPKLTFVRTLHGQLGPVSTLALADGRCVSLGVNGSIWVWDLEAGSGTEVSSGVDESDDGDDDAWERVTRRLADGVMGTVVFDERRIVSASGPDVEVRRFDV